jgi:hypothetical protein
VIVDTMPADWGPSARRVRKLPQRFDIRRSLGAPLALVLALILSITTSCSRQDSGFDYLRIQVDGQSTLAVMKKDIMIRGIVVYFHGIDQDEFAVTLDGARKALTYKLVNAGFAVVSSHAGGNAFNDSATLENYRQLGSMAMQHFQIQNIYFLAESLGAIPAINLFVSDYTPVRGFAAINPALDFASATSEWPAFAATYPPAETQVRNPMSFPFSALRGKNIRFYASPGDSLVRADANALAFQNRYQSVADISVVKCAGQNGDASCMQSDDIVKWFTQLDRRA